MIIQGNQSTSITIDGKDYVYFGGTNYLGIAHRAELWQAAEAAFKKFGFSSGASRLTSGETDLLLNLEKDLAAFVLSEASLVLPAGFMTNTAVVDALDEQVDFWIVQKSAHGSIKSALAQSRKVIAVDQPFSTFIDRPSLLAGLGLATCRLGIFAEPIDPLLGQLQDISALLTLLNDSDFLVLDEAHSIGVLGERGRGALEHFNIAAHPNVIRTGTFSKAFGAQGGFVIASTEIVELIKDRSGSFKLSTPLSPVACAAARESIRLVSQSPETTVRQLHANIHHTNQKLVERGFEQFASNCVPIYHLPDGPAIRQLRETLPGKGLYLPSVKSYFAGICKIGLRWTIQAGHTSEQLDLLLNSIAKT